MSVYVAVKIIFRDEKYRSTSNKNEILRLIMMWPYSLYFKTKNIILLQTIIKVDNDGRACGGCGDPYEGRPGPQDREAASD